MQKHRNLILFSLPVLLVAISSFTRSSNSFFHRQVDRNSIYNDTSYFLPNSSIGWGMLSSYLSTAEDSISIEIVLSRQVPTGYDWNLPSEIGTITGVYIPEEQRAIDFNEPNRNWRLAILPDGRCVIKLVNGPAPGGDMVIIPIKAKYRK